MRPSNTNRWTLIALLLVPYIWLNVTAFNEWRSTQRLDDTLLRAVGEVTDVARLSGPEQCGIGVRYNPITNILLDTTAVLPAAACDQYQPGDTVTVRYAVESPTIIQIETAVTPPRWLVAAALANILFVGLLFWASRSRTDA